MTSLAIYAAVNDISLALENQGKISEQTWEGPTAKAEDLPIFLDDFMKNNQITFEQLTDVSVAIGYGAFTGLRLSLIVAKSLALKYCLPLFAIPTMTAFAAQIVAEKKIKKFIACLYACRQEYNCILDQQEMTIGWPAILEIKSKNPDLEIITEEILTPSAKGLFLVKQDFLPITDPQKIIALSPLYSHSARIQKTKKKELAHLKAIYDNLE